MNEEDDLINASLNAIKQFKNKIALLESQQKEPIAIIGMGCRFPGGANNPELFAQLLQEGFDASSEVPIERWDMNKYYADSIMPGKIISKKSCFLNIPIDEFDANFFGISPREAEFLDPQQRLLLEVTWEALVNAGIMPASLKKKNCGVFLGICTHDYAVLLQERIEDEAIDAFAGTGTALSTASGRISYLLGIIGPSLSIDTACSSSLVALHEACNSLRREESDLIITGGVNVLLSPRVSINFSQAHMLAPDGQCKTFDQAADGYVRAEGCGIIILKRLRDAKRDGDTILAIIKGSAVNQDGASSGLTVPNGPAQERVITNALNNASLKPGDIDYIEAHGTGTRLGDPIEIEAIHHVFKTRQQPLIIGTVKTNIGHLEAAAGIAGIIKTILALQHEEIPRHLHFNSLNPDIVDLEKIPAKIPLETIAWPRKNSHIRRAGISSFGFSGTNAHVILEEAPLQTESVEKQEIPKIEFKRQRYWIDFKKNETHTLYYQQDWSSESIELIKTSEKISGKWLVSNIKNNDMQIALPNHFEQMQYVKLEIPDDFDTHDYTGFILFFNAWDEDINMGSAFMSLSEKLVRFFQKLLSAKKEIQLLLVVDHPLLFSSLHGFVRSVMQESDLIVVQLLQLSHETDNALVLTSALKYQADYFPLQWTGEKLVSLELKKQLVNDEKNSPINNEATYIITGGLGALGLLTAKTLIEQGIKHLVLLGRQPLHVEHQALFNSWFDKGITAEYYVADITDKNALRKLFKLITTSWPSIRGVFHTAGVIEDSLLSHLSSKALSAVLLPKVVGTCNLQALIREFSIRLDYFVCYASTAGILGNTGQSHYALANGFLIGLMNYRHSVNEPGLSIAWGPWNIGMGSSSPDLITRWKAHGWTPLQSEMATNALLKVMSSSQSEVMISDIDWSVFLQKMPVVPNYFKNFKKISEQSPLNSDNKNPNSAFMLELFLMDKSKRHARILLELISWINEMTKNTGTTIQKDAKLSDIGFDSLLMLELIAKTRHCFGQLVNIDGDSIRHDMSILEYADFISNQFNQQQQHILNINPIAPISYSTSTITVEEEHTSAHDDSINFFPTIIMPTKKIKILFLHGTGIDAPLTKEIMELNHWMDTFDHIEWVFIDSPYKTNAIPLNFMSLYKSGKYDKKTLYGRWDLYRSYARHIDETLLEKFKIHYQSLIDDYSDEKAAAFFAEFQKNNDSQEELDGEFMWRALAFFQEKNAYSPQMASFQRTLEYLKEICIQYGPFDGIAGMCEGAATAGLFIRQLELGNINIPNNQFKFLISLSGWIGDGHEVQEKWYQPALPVSLPSLHVCGHGDTDYAKALFARNVALFLNKVVIWHSEGHVIPELKGDLKDQMRSFLDGIITL